MAELHGQLATAGGQPRFRADFCAGLVVFETGLSGSGGRRKRVEGMMMARWGPRLVRARIISRAAPKSMAGAFALKAHGFTWVTGSWILNQTGSRFDGSANHSFGARILR